MPNFDKTGPCGKGPCTGCGSGPCGSKMGQKHLGRKHGLGGYFGCEEPKTKEEKAKVVAKYRKALEEELEAVKKEEANLA